jgi:hypothetical protein
MHRDLEKAYIPSCMECLRNKSATCKHMGLLHPLPILDECGNSMAMDFIGPLPHNDDFDCILSITDRLGSDMCIILTQVDINTEDLALLFFNTGIVRMDYPKISSLTMTSCSSQNSGTPYTS